MACVFLSYDRDDATKARAIAETLERSGHSVWWDTHIQGGAEFNREIEQALADADAVVVLWSEQAINSPWVRDEAATGRDRGRLVPVRLDEAMPPLGFRQYQSVDLSGWKRRGRPPLHDVLSAIDRLPSGDAEREGVKWRTPSPAPQRAPPRLMLIALAILAIASVALWFWRPWQSKIDAPLVAVVPADGSAAAGPLAADLLVKLGVLQSSHADTLQLVEPKSRQNPDFIIKVGGRGAGKDLQSSLMLIDNRTNTLLWAREFKAPAGKQADLRQQMAHSAAQVLDCAVQVLSSENETVKLPTLKLYLSGCADLSNLLAQNPRAASSIFERVVEQAPRFTDGWKKLLLADIQASRFVFGTDPLLREKLRKHVTQARRVDPEMAEAALAEGLVLNATSISQSIRLIDQAVEKDPDNPDILANRSIALTNVGLMQEALANIRRAVEANPLSPSARDALITALLNSDQIDAARNELQKSEEMWPGATNVMQSRFAVEFRAGDPVKALQTLTSGQLGPGFVTNAAHESYLKAKADPTPTNKELAIVNARSLYERDPLASWVYARALADFGRHEALVDFLLKSDARSPYATTWVIFRPSFSALHKDPRFMLIAKRFGASDFWRDTGKWPDFCSRPDLPYDCKSELAKLN